MGVPVRSVGFGLDGVICGALVGQDDFVAF
jgi:hypothetical protein